ECDGEPGLSHAAVSQQREQATVLPRQQGTELGNLLLPPDQSKGRGGDRGRRRLSEADLLSEPAGVLAWRNPQILTQGSLEGVEDPERSCSVPSTVRQAHGDQGKFLGQGVDRDRPSRQGQSLVIPAACLEIAHYRRKALQKLSLQGLPHRDEPDLEMA